MRRGGISKASQPASPDRPRVLPELISGPFHHGLVVVFSLSTALAVIAGVASLLRGGRYVHAESDRVWQDDEQSTPIR